MAKRVIKNKRIKKSNNLGLAIVALILNLIIPGLGSLIAGKNKPGFWQLALFFVGTILGIMLIVSAKAEFLILIGLILLIFLPLIAWIWGITTGAKLIKQSA